MQNKIFFWLWLLGVNLNSLYSQGIGVWSVDEQLPSSSIVLSDAIRGLEGVEYIEEWGIHEGDWVQQAGEDTLATVLRLSANLIRTRESRFNSIESKTNGASLSISQAFDEQGKLLSYGYSMCALFGKPVSFGLSLSEYGFGMGTSSHGSETKLFTLNLRDRQGRIKRRLFFSTDRYKYTRTNKLISQKKQGLKIVRRWVVRRWIKNKIHYEEMDETPKTIRQILRKKFLLMPDTLLKLERKIAEEEDKDEFSRDRKRLNVLMASHPVRNQPILSPFQQVYSYRGDTTIEWTIMAHPKSWESYWNCELVRLPKGIKRLPKTVKFNGRIQRLRVKSERDLVWVLLRERKINSKGQICQDLFFNRDLEVGYFISPFFEWINGMSQIVWTYNEKGLLVRQDFEVSDERKRYLNSTNNSSEGFHSFKCIVFGHFSLLPQTVNYHYPVIDNRGNWLLRVADRPGLRYTIRIIKYKYKT